jgi:hypothetical protein
VGLTASTAFAGLEFQLRVVDVGAGQPTNRPAPAGNTRYFEYTGSPLTLKCQIFAIVTGGSGGVTDGLSKVYASVLSAGDLVNGNVGPVAWGREYVYNEDTESWVWTLQSNGLLAGGTGSTLGVLSDLDGDGDIDLGSTDSSSAAGWLLARGTKLAEPTVTGPEHWIASFDFVVAPGTFDPSGNGWTQIDVFGRGGGDGEQNNIWYENGVATNSPAPTSTQGIYLYVASGAVVPGGPVVVGDITAGVILDGSGSTGSINTWAWDLDGDGLPDVTVNTPITFVSGDKLAEIFGGAQGTFAATLTTGLQVNPLLGANTAPFSFTIVPEPATMALLGFGALAFVIRRRK